LLLSYLQLLPLAGFQTFGGTLRSENDGSMKSAKPVFVVMLRSSVTSLPQAFARSFRAIVKRS
jgi:hypothetical protein